MLNGKRKQELDYFGYFEQALNLCEEEAMIMQMSMANFDADKLEALIHEVHMLEHRADDLKHQMFEQLMREFLPPLDRDDIIQMAEECDDIADAIDDLPLHLYMYNVRTCRPDVNTIMDGMLKIVSQTKQMMAHLHEFKQPKKILELIKEIGDQEEVGDGYYLKAMHDLFSGSGNTNLAEVVAWKDIYDRMEDCYDNCEKVSDMVRNIIIKNS